MKRMEIEMNNMINLETPEEKLERTSYAVREQQNLRSKLDEPNWNIHSYKATITILRQHGHVDIDIPSL
jgi:hypothetical protein